MVRSERRFRPRRRKPQAVEAVVGIFAFEVGRVMSKLVHLWDSLSHKQVDRLRNFISDSVGLKKLVSDDEDYIQGFIPGELFENMIPVTKFVARIGKNHCSDPCLKDFEHAVSDWIDNGADPFCWELPRKEMKKEANKMERFVSINEALYDEMNHLSDLERTLKDITATLDGPILLEFQNKIELKRLEVENLKKESLWNLTFNHVGIILARSVFTIFSRIKSVYGVPQLIMANGSDHASAPSRSIFGKYKLLDAPPDTLGAAALHYANIVIQVERAVRFAFLGKHDLYDMLPANMKDEINEKLPSIRSMGPSVIDLAAKQKVASDEILEWLVPLAHNTKKWHSKSNFQLKANVSRSHVFLVQTLYLANQQKTEATILELIFGMQYTQEAGLEALREYDRVRRALKAASLEDQDKGKSPIVLQKFKAASLEDQNKGKSPIVLQKFKAASLEDQDKCKSSIALQKFKAASLEDQDKGKSSIALQEISNY